MWTREPGAPHDYYPIYFPAYELSEGNRLRTESHFKEHLPVLFVYLPSGLAFADDKAVQTISPPSSLQYHINEFAKMTPTTAWAYGQQWSKPPLWYYFIGEIMQRLTTNTMRGPYGIGTSAVGVKGEGRRYTILWPVLAFQLFEYSKNGANHSVPFKPPRRPRQGSSPGRTLLLRLGHRRKCRARLTWIPRLTLRGGGLRTSAIQ